MRNRSLCLNPHILSFFVLSIGVAAEEKDTHTQSSAEYQNDIKQLQQDTKTTINDIEILRRDQINYRIEKDLIKETYSSNLQSINITITIVFGVFGLLGYLGMKSIKDIKNDYQIELDNLRKLKIGFETDLGSLRSRQQQFEGQVGELTKTNEEQNQRLKTLELIEKISNLISSSYWEWALEYIEVGLVAAPKNIMLLSQKVNCCYKLGRLNLAIDTSKSILEVDPRNIVIAINLAEFLLLENREEEYKSIYLEYKSEIDEKYDGNLIVYFKAIANFVKGNIDIAKSELIQFASKFPDELKPKLGNWSCDETLHYVSKLPDGKTKQLMENTVQFFQGQLSTSMYKEVLNS